MAVRVIDKNAERLFSYLKDVLYDPGHAELDLDALDEDFKKLGKGLLFFAETLRELREFSRDLSRGELSGPLPSRQNELAAPLKALHATLKHVTWQSQQVAKGDYQQRLDFMGEFADAFNTMTEQLDQRRKALEAEIENGKKKTRALEQSNSLFEAITTETSLLIFVLDARTGERLFTNNAAENLMLRRGGLARQVNAWLKEAASRKDLAGQDNEVLFGLGKKTEYYMVKAYPLHWRRQEAVAYVLRDISPEKRKVQQLEGVAYQDALTGIFNRYYGMDVLWHWLGEKRRFCLCFVDIDNLKFVNDTYGHSEGDVYIVAVANKLCSCLPEVVVCRLGGDEFMLLLPNVSAERAEQHLHRLREELIEDSEQETVRRYLRSISYGLVVVDRGTTRTASELLSEADERMYEFKRAHKAERSELIG